MDLPNCLSAVDFVPRYNAHSDFTDVKVDPDTDTAVVICVGNVARMLAIDPPELDPTDTAKYVLPVFKSSKIRKALICGPRSPEHAAFNAPELRDLPKLEYPDVYIDEALINEANLRVEQMG